MSEIIIVTCSGLSSTGKLTKQAAVLFMQRYPGLFDSHIFGSSIESSFLDVKPGCSRVVAVDGCSDCCAKKKLSSCNLNPSGHIVATELGIEKRGAEEPTFAEIEILVLAIKKAVKRLE
ncbi:MAG: putative zinc-binding protein [Methanomicrobium sp.]|nr:putative zinc-binding protein [Methanomicrobium sp.]